MTPRKSDLLYPIFVIALAGALSILVSVWK